MSSGVILASDASDCGRKKSCGGTKITYCSMLRFPQMFYHIPWLLARPKRYFNSASYSHVFLLCASFSFNASPVVTRTLLTAAVLISNTRSWSLLFSSFWLADAKFPIASLATSAIGLVRISNSFVIVLGSRVRQAAISRALISSGENGWLKTEWWVACLSCWALVFKPVSRSTNPESSLLYTIWNLEFIAGLIKTVPSGFGTKSIRLTPNAETIKRSNKGEWAAPGLSSSMNQLVE